MEKAVKVLSDMGSRLNQRYDLLRRVNQKNIECYDDWANKYDKNEAGCYMLDWC